MVYHYDYIFLKVWFPFPTLLVLPKSNCFIVDIVLNVATPWFAYAIIKWPCYVPRVYNYTIKRRRRRRIRSRFQIIAFCRQLNICLWKLFVILSFYWFGQKFGFSCINLFVKASSCSSAPSCIIANKFIEQTFPQ